MGTWGTAIKSNDTSADIYAEFFDLYNDGKKPKEIKEKLISNNPNGENDFWFALALSLWETKSLSTDVLEKVREIISSESDLKLWEELEASESDIKKRKIVLEKFLIKLESEKSKPKPRKRKKEPIFEKGTCLTFKLKNGNYGGAIVLDADHYTKLGYNLIVSTRLNQPTKPTISDFKKSKVLIKNFANWNYELNANWVLPNKFKKEFSSIFENIGKIVVNRKYDPIVNQIRSGLTSDWDFIIIPVNSQFEFEKTNRKFKTFSINKLTKHKKWWQL